MGYRRKFKPSKTKTREFAIKMKEIEGFCNQNNIQMSYNKDSYYFSLYGQKYRVSNHTVEKSNERAYNYFGEQIRIKYHPDGREDNVIYIHASKTRIMEIYNDLKEGYILNSRGYRVTDINFAKSIVEKIIDVYKDYSVFELTDKRVGIINLRLLNLSQEEFKTIFIKKGLNEFDSSNYYIFDNYYEALQNFKEGIEKDLNALGIFDENGKYNFYLNEDELSYLKFSEKLEEQQSMNEEDDYEME